ncbi:hypothetical protein [Pseudoalteromonas obscura]|uniref:Uncharacterized protein n=1 Tax=Pseudoalteromonas obscura TaxID=3048491 RepID=A0ABT7ESH9_9GAMM|nr:hypothetical protein [Pseudoalteromonas sp. P94(2023)]MDK2597920.1 hypothetical protein [Pseudoalteromonas sp. P94(2023)]
MTHIKDQDLSKIQQLPEEISNYIVKQIQSSLSCLKNNPSTSRRNLLEDSLIELTPIMDLLVLADPSVINKSTKLHVLHAKLNDGCSLLDFEL